MGCQLHVQTCQTTTAPSCAAMVRHSGAELRCSELTGSYEVIRVCGNDNAGVSVKEASQGTSSRRHRIQCLGRNQFCFVWTRQTQYGVAPPYKIRLRCKCTARIERKGLLELQPQLQVPQALRPIVTCSRLSRRSTVDKPGEAIGQSAPLLEKLEAGHPGYPRPS